MTQPMKCFWCGYMPVTSVPSVCPGCQKKLTRVVHCDDSFLGHMAALARMDIEDQEDTRWRKEVDRLAESAV